MQTIYNPFINPKESIKPCIIKYECVLLLIDLILLIYIILYLILLIELILAGGDCFDLKMSEVLKVHFTEKNVLYSIHGFCWTIVNFCQ